MILALAAIVGVFAFGIRYLQNYEGNQVVLTIIAIVWGVGSVALFFFLAFGVGGLVLGSVVNSMIGSMGILPVFRILAVVIAIDINLDRR